LSYANLCQPHANLFNSRGPFPRNMWTSSPHALADLIIEDPGTFLVRALGADPFSPKATQTNLCHLCPPRDDIFRFSGPSPLRCGPNPDALGPILFTRTLGGLLATSASRADLFSTRRPFALRMHCFIYRTRTSARRVRRADRLHRADICPVMCGPKPLTHRPFSFSRNPVDDFCTGSLQVRTFLSTSEPFCFARGP